MNTPKHLLLVCCSLFLSLSAFAQTHESREDTRLLCENRGSFNYGRFHVSGTVGNEGKARTINFYSTTSQGMVHELLGERVPHFQQLRITLSDCSEGEHLASAIPLACQSNEAVELELLGYAPEGEEAPVLTKVLLQGARIESLLRSEQRAASWQSGTQVIAEFSFYAKGKVVELEIPFRPEECRVPF